MSAGAGSAEAHTADSVDRHVVTQPTRGHRLRRPRRGLLVRARVPGQVPLLLLLLRLQRGGRAPRGRRRLAGRQLRRSGRGSRGRRRTCWQHDVGRA